ncbi:MAG: GNAT family N-acetyltransferase [Bdellovibrionales bacterium]|nr:GNAT family N-acetyltransferase [Bdellovibrionales bacterium]
MIQFRPASETDAQTLADLGKSTFIETFAKDNSKDNMDIYVSKTFGLDQQLSEIRDPYRRIEIAWDGDAPAGFLHLLKGPADASVIGPKPIELLRLYIDSRWQGKGLGAALMNRGLQYSREEGFQTLWLGVWERNFRAQAFYKKFGFRTVGKHIFSLGSDDQIDLILERAVDL